MVLEVLKNITNQPMQQTFAYEGLNAAKNRFVNWQSKGFLAFTLAAFFCLGLAACFFIAQYFKNRRIASTQGSNSVEQAVTLTARNTNIIHNNEPVSGFNDKKILAVIDQIFIPICLKFPIPNGVFVLSLASSSHPIETEIVPIIESVFNDKTDLNNWMLSNSNLLQKIKTNNFIQYDIKACLICPTQNAGLSYCHLGNIKCKNFEVSDMGCLGRDTVINVNLKPYLNFKIPALDTATELDLEDVLKKGNIDINEVYIETNKDDNDLIEEFMSFFREFAEMKKNISSSELRQEIISEIEKLSTPLPNLPEHLQVVYDQLATKNPDYKPLFNLNDSYSKEDVIQAGRKIALKIHPDKNPTHLLTAQELFSILSKIKFVLEQEAS